MVISRRRLRSEAGDKVSIATPSITTLPPVGRSNRLMQRTSVDLPAPDMPMMP